MSKKKIRNRKICYLCGAKRYGVFLTPEVRNNVTRFVCKNSDMCVLKIAYLKRVRKLKK